MLSYLTKTGLLSADEIDDAMQQTRRIFLKKGDYLIREGEVCKQVGFVQKGSFRSFYHSSNRDEITYCFRFEGNFVTSYSSYLTGQPSNESIQALTDSELLTLPRSYVQQLENKSVGWLKLLKMLAESEFMEMERRVFVLQKESAEKRYEDLLRHHPELLQLVSLQHIASYLGITQRHLSRIRAAK